MTPLELIREIADEGHGAPLDENLWVEITVNGIRQLHRVTYVDVTGCAPTLHTEFVENLGEKR